MPIPYGRALIPIGREKKMSLLKEIVARILFPNREVDFIPVLDGAFSPNQRLDEARVLGPEITSPDDMVFGKDGALYISSERKIYRCTGLHFENRDLLVELPAMVGGLAQLPSGHLLACVSGYGLFQVSTSGDIVRKMESVQGQALRCLTSVTIADDGTVYVTDGSSRNQPEDWLPDLMQNLSPTGRLIACKSDFSDATVCIERLNDPDVVDEEALPGGCLPLQHARTQALAHDRQLLLHTPLQFLLEETAEERGKDSASSVQPVAAKSVAEFL
jgi:hypothetical protein